MAEVSGSKPQKIKTPDQHYQVRETIM